jgi:hypothetical protein
MRLIGNPGGMFPVAGSVNVVVRGVVSLSLLTAQNASGQINSCLIIRTIYFWFLGPSRKVMSIYKEQARVYLGVIATLTPLAEQHVNESCSVHADPSLSSIPPNACNNLTIV